MKSDPKLTSSTRGILTVAVALLVTVTANQAADPLPAPTGPHKTGRMSFHWKDAAREELETSAADDKRARQSPARGTRMARNAKPGG